MLLSGALNKQPVFDMIFCCGHTFYCCFHKPVVDIKSICAKNSAKYPHDENKCYFFRQNKGTVLILFYVVYVIMSLHCGYLILEQNPPACQKLNQCYSLCLCCSQFSVGL